MGKLENEIVKFIAEVELDPQTAAQYQQNLADTEKHNEALRKSISETVRKMEEMRAQGKQNTEEFKRLQASLDADVKALKESTKQSDKYAAALGVQAMSMTQLQQRAKLLRKEMNAVHKETNPQLWEKYHKELQVVEKRMAELKGGTDSFGKAFSGLKGKIVPTFDVVSLGLKGIHALVQGGKKLWGDLKTETQKWGDAIQVEVAAAEAVWHHFVRNISASRNEITLTYKEVAALAREAAKLKDEIFELTNSYKIEEAQAQKTMQELEATFRNTSLPIDERKKALEDMKALELQLAHDRLIIAQQEEDAAYDHFRIQTALDREVAESFITNYLEAKKKGLTEEAEAYAQLIGQEEYLNTAVTSGAFVSKKTYQNTCDNLERVRQKIADTSDEVKAFYAQLQQYNLGDGAATTAAYADAVAGRIQAQAAANPSAMEAKYARLNGQLSGKGSGRGASSGNTTDPYTRQIKAQEELYKEQLLQLKKSLADQEITQNVYDAKALTLQQAHINAKIAINKAYHKSTVDLETQQADIRINQQKKIQAVLEKGNEEFLAEMERQSKETDAAIDAYLDSLVASVTDAIDDPALLDPVKRLAELAEDELTADKKSRGARRQQADTNYDTELATLTEKHELMLVSEEEFLARKKALHEEHAKEIAQIELEAWENAFSVASDMLNQMARLSSSMQEAEFAQVEAWKEKELALAGDNADEQTRIEEEAEAKKLEIQKKYADVDMAINIAKTIADGAVAAIKAFVDLGPIAGGIMAGIIAATTVAEVATIVAQRNAIQNAAPGAASASSGESSVVGFSEGGFTGQGGRHQVAGVVHRGEYVVAAPELRDPEVARDVARIEQKRRARIGGRQLFGSAGFAEGGFTSESGNQETDNADMIQFLSDILDVLLDIRKTPIPAILAVSDYEATKARLELSKKFTSLRRKNG
ncbi:MAG: hypothetical protein J6N50_07835 [Bacteroidales bacterium]|nr:hypothetical protein [Bacteroidales bacterium]